MNVRPTTQLPSDTPADTIVVGVFEDEGIAQDADGALQALVDSGEARRALRQLAGTHAARAEARGALRKWAPTPAAATWKTLVGPGRREEFDPDRARSSAAVAASR